MIVLTILNLILFTTVTVIANRLGCQTVSDTCIDEKHFLKCVEIEGKLSGSVISCQDGTRCDYYKGSAICTNSTHREASVRTLLDNSVNQSPCIAEGKNPALSCYQYYECKKVLLWWESELKSCENGAAFDVVTKNCAPEFTVDCDVRGTTTTSSINLPPIDEPECKGPTKHPALLCYQYFECVKKLWWFKPELKTCPAGQAFDRLKGECVCAGLLNCVLPVVAPNTCNGPSNYSSIASCNEYYECSKKLFWWEARVRQCPLGHVYDQATCQCVTDLQKCTDKVPKCYGYFKYPASEKNQYYECTMSESGLEWIPILKTCELGYIFLQRFGNCVPDWFAVIP